MTVYINVQWGGKWSKANKIMFFLYEKPEMYQSSSDNACDYMIRVSAVKFRCKYTSNKIYKNL